MSKFLTTDRSHHSTLVKALAILCLGIISLNTRAQTSKPADSDAGAKPLAFDAISIKPNKAGEAMIGDGVMGHFTVTKITRDGFTSANTTAKALIATAYGLKEYLISGGPNWIESKRYDVEAKVTDFDALASTQSNLGPNLPQSPKPVNSPQLTKPQRGQMMRSLLADRFKLVAHYDTKEARRRQTHRCWSAPRFSPDVGAEDDGSRSVHGPKSFDCIAHRHAVPASAIHHCRQDWTHG
jgi:hypothetical protein